MMILRRKYLGVVLVLGLFGAIGLNAVLSLRHNSRVDDRPPEAVLLGDLEFDRQSEETPLERQFKRRDAIDPSGYTYVTDKIRPWAQDATLEEISESFKQPGHEFIRAIETTRSQGSLTEVKDFRLSLTEATCWNYEGNPRQALETLSRLRTRVEGNSNLAHAHLFSLIYLQGVSSLRLGETENCVMCRGEGSCILPLSPSARHVNEQGSRDAIRLFTEYLQEFPGDLEVCWLLNVAAMTLGEHPDGIAPRFRISLDRYNSSEHGIGKFRDVSHLVGVNRLNMAGGTILDDFDGDGLLDLVFTSFDPCQPMAFYRNIGDGTFEDRTKAAGLLGQLGGLNCVQADFDNDGHLDIFIPRGAWISIPMRPSLLRNTGHGAFIDVTKEAGLIQAMNTDTAQWADFDNDGWLDLFVCGEAQPCRLYRNQGNGTFHDVAGAAGLDGRQGMWKGCSWFDYDNDGYADLFLNNYTGNPALFHNERNGTFKETTVEMGVSGPQVGLSCWAWDYDNDGWTDVFATSYDRTLEDVLKGLLGAPHGRHQSKLYRNVRGERFEDVTERVGLTECFSVMGSNFGDFDNDGFLDFYLGTGDHDLATLVPNRMFRNLEGIRFADISSSSETGHLQKGHGIGCGDWDRDGDLDVVVEMGGAIPGDKYHNVLFANPGQGNHWLNVKLVGKTSNRNAIGARIKVVTAGEHPLTIHRHVSSGSSFGANPLEQLVGLGRSERVAELEIKWPTSGTTQVFRDVAVDMAIEITEFDTEYKELPYRPIALPKEETQK